MRISCLINHAFHTTRRQLTALNHGHIRFITSRTKPYDAAIIGGGITGLTTAFRLSQDPNCTKVTLYEKEDRVGGWISSDKEYLRNGSDYVVFEDGPRTLRTQRPSCLPMLDLLFCLDLENEIVLTSSKSPAAVNRYIYYPDHLARLPGYDPNVSLLENFWKNARTLAFEPAFRSIFWDVWHEVTKPARPDASRNQDESVAEFVSRRLSPNVTDNLVSAVLHGIYAGDVDQLSAETLLGPYRKLELSEDHVILSAWGLQRKGRAFLNCDSFLAIHSVEHDRPQHYWQSLSRIAKGTSVLTLRDGLDSLAQRLRTVLEASEKVDLLINVGVNSIKRDPETSNLAIQSVDGHSRSHNRVIATAPAPELAKAILAGAEGDQNAPVRSAKLLEQHNYAVTVMVVNLYYEKPDLLPYQGFGYLIPRSVPFDQNPERALGVIFASETSPGQDTAPGTKLTVMMGGHWWDGWAETDIPDEDSAHDMATSVLERHLGIDIEPILSSAKLLKNAIPQYTVGHLSRMNELSQSVREEFAQRLTLAGNWYSVNGVGVNDCITQAYNAATYGVGACKPDIAGRMIQPLKKLNYRDWDLEGGICTAPTRHLLAGIEDMRLFSAVPRRST